MFFDSHCHLNNDNISDQEVKELASEIEASEVDKLMDVGYDMASSKRSVDHARTYDWCYAVVGIHPHEVKDIDDSDLEMIKVMAGMPKVQAIGEIGLDFHYDNSPRDEQRYRFRQQIQLANQLKMPIVIHSRDADQETMDILKEEGAFSEERKSFFPPRPDGSGDARVLLHCYSGSKEMAQQYVKLGATISIAGPVTFKNNRKTKAVAQAVPLEHLLIETDAPYLAPEPKRGRKNKSPYIKYTAQCLADLKGISLEALATATQQNAMRFFNIKG